jgi:hypothetical protein
MRNYEAEIAERIIEVISKIEGTGPIRAPQQIRRATKSGGASSTSFAKELDETGDSSASQGISGTAAVTGVLGVQEIDDALAQASRGKMRAMDILDRLDDLRVELLTGVLSREKLVQLTRIVGARRAQVTDPRLAEVLDEIDLRAQVELAKYDRPVE